MAEKSPQTDSELIARASQARDILESHAFQRAFEHTRLAIIQQIEATPLDDSVSAENLRKCLRLLRDVRGNLEQALNEGKLALFRIEQARERKLNPFKGIFR